MNWNGWIDKWPRTLLHSIKWYDGRNIPGTVLAFLNPMAIPSDWSVRHNPGPREYMHIRIRSCHWSAVQRSRYVNYYRAYELPEAPLRAPLSRLISRWSMRPASSLASNLTADEARGRQDRHVSARARVCVYEDDFGHANFTLQKSPRRGPFRLRVGNATSGGESLILVCREYSRDGQSLVINLARGGNLGRAYTSRPGSPPSRFIRACATKGMFYGRRGEYLP